MRKEITLMEVTDMDTLSIWLEEKDSVVYICVVTYEGNVTKKALSSKQIIGLKNFLNE